MTTVVDPFGTPTAIFNRSGVTIIDFDASTSTIPQVPDVPSGHTVLIVREPSPQTGPYSVQLPANCEIGDVIEVYRAPAEAMVIYLASGENFLFSGSSVSTLTGQHLLLRKVSATEWARIISAT